MDRVGRTGLPWVPAACNLPLCHHPFFLGELTMNRPSFLDRHPALAVLFMLLLWLALGLAEGMGY